jgi:hypothetical protein
MQAAVSLFAEQGVRASSIAQICARAEVSRPTFYRCFEDKDALVSRMYENSVNAFVENFLGTARLGDQEELHHQLDDLLDSIFEHSELAQLVFRESSDPDSPAARIIDDAFEHAAEVMTKGAQGYTPSRVYLKSERDLPRQTSQKQSPQPLPWYPASYPDGTEFALSRVSSVRLFDGTCQTAHIHVQARVATSCRHTVPSNRRTPRTPEFRASDCHLQSQYP